MKFLSKDKMVAGFSLPELMVVAVIIGILATLAIPRLRTFIAQSRQSEAKMNISEIAKLQHLYMSAKDTYVAVGAAPTAAGNTGAGVMGYDNNGGTVSRKCDLAQMKKIGYRPRGCINFRYSYWVQTATASGVDRFIVGAYAPSNADARIFPTCDGSHQEGTTDARDPRPLAHSHPQAGSLSVTGPTKGDTWVMDDLRKIQSDDIVTVCTGENKKGANVGASGL